MKKKFLFKVKIITYLIFSFLYHSAFAFGNLNLTDARSFALGSLRALSQESLNPANLSFSKKQIGFSVLNQFEMKELNTFYLWGKYPNEFLDASVTISHYGYEDYQIIQAQTGLAKKILPELSLGINLIYFQEPSLWEEEAKKRLSSDVGICFRIGQNIEGAFLANNVLHTFPYELWDISGGLNYKALENSFLLVESSYNADKIFNLSIGFEYKWVEELQFRVGTQIFIKTTSFGIGYQWNKWIIDAGFSLHSVLGVSSIISLNYKL